MLAGELFCSNAAGVNNCGDGDRGYVWLVTFIDVIDNGLQTEPYKSSYDTHYNQHLSVTSDFLYGCPGNDGIVPNGQVTTDVGKWNGPAWLVKQLPLSILTREVQEICMCDDATTTITYMGQTATGTHCSRGCGCKVSFGRHHGCAGHVSVYTKDASYGASCASCTSSKQYMVTFNTYVGDAPPVVVSAGDVAESVKGKERMLTGIADYSVDLFLDSSDIASVNEFYIRVAAHNSVGTGLFVSPYESPVVVYEGILPSPQNFTFIGSPNSRSLRFLGRSLII